MKIRSHSVKPIAPLLLLFTAALLLYPQAAQCQTKKAQAVTNESCLTCHSDAGMASEKRPLPGPVVSPAVEKEKLSLQVTVDSLKGSVHEGLSCVDCHEGIKDVPHDEKLPDVNCGNCHSDVPTEMAAGVHAPKGKESRYAPICITCHGAHQIRPKSDAASTINSLNLPATCGACHGNEKLMAEAGVRVADPFKNFMKSDHWLAVTSGKAPNAATCSDCHEAHKILSSRDPNSPVSKHNLPATCGRCHGAIRTQFVVSVHGKALSRGNLEAPSCADCHGEHDIEGPKRSTSNVYAANIGRSTCPQCHASVRLSRRFNLPEGMVQSYQASFHGLATRYGSTNVANCASCHGAHDILPSIDPASSINPKNLTGTCGKCHPGAGETFSRISIHQREDVVESPVLAWIRKFYILIIAGTLLALGLHNLLDYIRRYKETLRLLKPVAVYLRMTLAERVQHWLLLTTFFTLVITGFALKYPDSFWAWPFKLFPGGFEWRGWLHRAAAVLMIGDGLYHVYYLAFTKRGRRLIVDMMPSVDDVKDVWNQLSFYLGWKRHGADFRRFSYGEKVEYLALIWGTLVMVGTGFILWFKTWFSRYLPSWGYSAAELIHFYEAVLAFSTIIIWHLYAVLVHTERPPFNPTWLTGQLTRGDMEHNHPGELEEIEKRREQEELANASKREPKATPGPEGERQ